MRGVNSAYTASGILDWELSWIYSSPHVLSSSANLTPISSVLPWISPRWQRSRSFTSMIAPCLWMWQGAWEFKALSIQRMSKHGISCRRSASHKKFHGFYSKKIRNNQEVADADRHDWTGTNGR